MKLHLISNKSNGIDGIAHPKNILSYKVPPILSLLKSSYEIHLIEKILYSLEIEVATNSQKPLSGVPVKLIESKLSSTPI